MSYFLTSVLSLGILLSNYVPLIVAQIQCADLWDSNSTSTCSIPGIWINDDWCDCPENCEDEQYWTCSECYWYTNTCPDCDDGQPCESNTYQYNINNSCNFFLQKLYSVKHYLSYENRNLLARCLFYLD